MGRRRAQPWVFLAGLWVSAATLACPNCPTAQVVKAAVLGEGFWTYLVMAVVPFLLIGALSAWLYRIGLSPREVAPARQDPEPWDSKLKDGRVG
jgi:hypothetical protein